MNFYITCICGEKVNVNAENDEAAVSKLIIAMDKHIAAKDHPEVPKNLTDEQKEGMVRTTMKKAE
ncbi:MAG TPA: hypothetical protein VGA29_07850 [Ignavibacteriaceae bacterium]|jgi:hypothetical protein